MSKRFKNWKYPKFKKRIGHLYETKYGWLVSYPENLVIGQGTDIGCFTYIQAKYRVFIGTDVQIGAGCKIYSYDSIGEKRGAILISKGAKIGANSVILPNVVINNNEFIPAGSIVWFDNDEYERKIKCIAENVERK